MDGASNALQAIRSAIDELAVLHPESNRARALLSEAVSDLWAARDAVGDACKADAPTPRGKEG